MNNICFLLSTMKIISGELRNLTEFKQVLLQLSCKSLRYLVVNMVSKIISINRLYFDGNEPQVYRVSTTAHNDGESCFTLAAGLK